ncbi:terpenoid cyclases/Protein prenyltransferase [Xylaria bambusicola]|uniref:terpenoid cyclases/Protein prenyltransferase n=1 Tax=Xylaria bambusicola TaxID=326684 RepID=UPI0020089A4A|nr:terpenoid cyclases/Protein prenyltransferase [Xylaria bambusicola]KAI0523905.1 terpenoid cyclases/Protein prenyltransferase [Xylaria bambusicola]
MATAAVPLDPPLDTARHVRYWQRCFRSGLPHHYTSNDSIRLTLGFFILSALDLLSPSSPTPLIPPEDRPNLRAWVLRHQHPHGGFCGSPHHVLPDGLTSRFDADSQTYVARDPANANIAATGFALLCLGVLADGDGSDAFSRVDRVRTLTWLKKLQREDGSFGEVLTDDGRISGGRDMRYCYIAAIIRWALGGGEGDKSLDFNVDALVGHIRRAQTFDGGMSESSTHESHSGYAYCAIAALALLDSAGPGPSPAPNSFVQAGIPSIPALIHFLASRQFMVLDPSADDDDDDNGATTDHETPNLCSPDLEPQLAGFNGRLNKLPDTCYTWWNSGALSLLGENNLVSRGPARRFILEKTQHLIGGFAKYPDGPPDVYHAYMGLAALANMGGAEGEPGLAKFDPRLCIGADAAARIYKARNDLLHPKDGDRNEGD